MRTLIPRFSFSYFALALPIVLADMVAPCGGVPHNIPEPSDTTSSDTSETAGTAGTAGTGTDTTTPDGH